MNEYLEIALILFGRLAITVFAEGVLTAIWFKNGRMVYFSVLCNLITNPALNILVIAAVSAFGAAAYVPAVALMELAVVAVEAYIWRSLCRFSWGKALWIAFITNLLSFGAGLAAQSAFRGAWVS